MVKKQRKPFRLTRAEEEVDKGLKDNEVTE